MPTIERPTIRGRILEFLRSNPNREFVARELAKAIPCDLSIVVSHCRSLAASEPDIWVVVPPSTGVAFRVYCASKPRKLT